MGECYEHDWSLHTGFHRGFYCDCCGHVAAAIFKICDDSFKNFLSFFAENYKNSSALSQWCLLVNESFSLYACSTHASRRRLRLNARRDDVTWRISSQTCSNLEELQLLRMWFCANFFDHKITKPWIEWLRDKLHFKKKKATKSWRIALNPKSWVSLIPKFTNSSHSVLRIQYGVVCLE